MKARNWHVVGDDQAAREIDGWSKVLATAKLQSSREKVSSTGSALLTELEKKPACCVDERIEQLSKLVDEYKCVAAEYRAVFKTKEIPEDAFNPESITEVKE
jgi:hypothetical protein